MGLFESLTDVFTGHTREAAEENQGRLTASRTAVNAREERSPLIVSYSLAQAAAGRFGSGAAGCVWAVCHAARSRASN